ncbi:MAG: hypothetical protein HYR91_13315 [Flavobacteriia bacterium]|nr:hypothetical protein [Flavobacteriia bacterium]
MKLKINFILKSGKEKVRPVIATLSFGYKEYDALKKKSIYKIVTYYTGVTFRKDEWDNENGRPYSDVKYGAQLQLKKKIEDVFLYLELDNDVKQSGGITPKILKSTLDEKLKGKDSSKTVNRIRLVEFIEQELITSNEFTVGTINHYKTQRNKLVAFEKEIGKQIYTTDLDAELYLAFKTHATASMNKNNAVWGWQKDFISVLSKIRKKHKIKVYNPIEEIAPKDKVKMNEPDALYFTFEQITQIIKYKPETEMMKNVKLILLTLIFTGCRESDVSKIEPKHVYKGKGDTFKYTQILTKKGDVEMIVPLLKPLEDAINENGGKPATPITQQKFNIEVKNLIRDCGLKHDITLSYLDKKGKKQFAVGKFHEFITSHIGRRTFITNLINFIPIPVLTKMTGHKLKDKSVIFIYNKMTLLENAVLFRKLLKLMSKDYPDHFLIKLI